MALPLLSGCSGSDDDDSSGMGGMGTLGKGGTTAASGGTSTVAGASGATNTGGSVSSGGSAGTTATSGGGGSTSTSGGASTGGTSGGTGGSTSTNGGGGGGAGGQTAGSGGTAGGVSGGASTGGTTGAPTDAKTILEKFKPTGSKASGYETWMNKEIGTPTVAATVLPDGNIKAPVLIPEGATYDGMGQSIKPSIPGCDGSQTESQPPIFILAPGATLKNVTINPPGCDGVHMMGDNTLENITWTDVGEDAASTRSYFPGGKITIKGGSAKSADDKVFQFNAPVQVTISDFTATNISKMIRQNGGSSFAMTVDLINVKVSGCKEAVVRSDTSNCKVKATNVSADCTVHLIKAN